MKYLSFFICLLFACTSASGQFQLTEKGLTIIVTDGTEAGRNSEQRPPNELIPAPVKAGKDIPSSYDELGSKGAGPLVFNDPIRELGMSECIQAAAFLERPEYGRLGFMLIFSLNDSIGGKQAELIKDGKAYYGVYRLIRQKLSSDEEIPVGMTSYQIAGTFLLLGIS